MAKIEEDLRALDRLHGKVAVVGSMNVDYTITAPHLPEPGETVTGGPLALLPGGKSGNQAAAAALLGAQVQMFGAVGNDSNADFLLAHLKDAGVDASQVRHVEGPSGLTVITVDDAGENTIVYSPGSNAKVDVEYVMSKQGALTDASVLGLCLESPMETVTECARLCHDAGVTVLLNNSPFRPDLPQELIDHADILLLNEVEMTQLLGIDAPEDDDWSDFDWEDAVNRLAAFGFRQTVVTLGGDGSMVLDATADEHVTHIDPVRIEPVDTTGCGDSFMGTILAALSSGLTLVQAANLASYVSAYAATGRGAQASYGTPAEIREKFGA
ncbi:MAG: ribokinase [Bifidobacterium sp.]|nr:ribokinase [Bifidobacterium sp.]